jgi:hypothetical protein
VCRVREQDQDALLRRRRRKDQDVGGAETVSALSSPPPPCRMSADIALEPVQPGRRQRADAPLPADLKSRLSWAPPAPAAGQRLAAAGNTAESPAALSPAAMAARVVMVRSPMLFSLRARNQAGCPRPRVDPLYCN